MPRREDRYEGEISMVRWGDDLDSEPDPFAQLMSVENFRAIADDIRRSLRSLRVFFQARRA